jgi:hypothetical protein
MDDVTIFALFQELLVDLGATQKSLATYAKIYAFLYNAIKVLIGIFMIINTVFAFTEQDETVRRIFQVINAVFVSGLLGNFGIRQRDAEAKITTINYVMKTLMISMAKLGLGVVPQPSIIDTNFVGGPVFVMQQMRPATASSSLHLSDLIDKSEFRLRLIALQTLIDSRH